MKIYSKTVAPFFNKQSAFSLIEVLIALVILSLGIMGSGKLLVESTAGFHLCEQHAEAMLIASAIVDSVSIDREGVTVDQILRYWQNKLDDLFPGSQLTIGHQKLEDKCVYTITLSFALPTLKPLTVKVAV